MVARGARISRYATPKADSQSVKARFRARKNMSDDQARPRRTQVLVVGAGPVGLMMAIELARYGIAARIIDKLPQPTDKSKALAVWSRTLELMDRAKVSAPVIATGNKVDANNFFVGSEKLGQITFDEVKSPYPFALMIPQDETERVLRERLSEFGVEVERAVELTNFTAFPDHVAITLSDASGHTETLEAEWLVACDGAHSTVRHELGKVFAGDTVATDFVLADVHLSGVPAPPSQICMFSHADGVLALFPITPQRYRIIADIGPASGAPRAEPTLDDVQRIIERRGPGGVQVTNTVWLSTFRVNERQVADYRAGRVFLAGDAAHVHSPAGGQGMNTGLQDACNLAWKLALVCHDTCLPDRLLASYSEERSPIAHQVIVQSGRLTALMTTRNHTWQAVRNHVAGVMLGLAPVRHALADLLTEITLGYPQSWLTATRSHAHGGPKAGERAPIRCAKPPVGAGTRPRFALFADAGDAAEAITVQYPDLVDATIRPPFHKGGLWLVRPDGYVAIAATREASGQLADYLACLAPSARPAPTPQAAASA
jgi:2-polyprenyl-6-methoxyphenol hydroxylase-like FAD-dependent oxidoreductase